MPHNKKKKKAHNKKSNITHDSIEFFKLTQNTEFSNDVFVLRKEIGITDYFDISNNIITGALELEKEEDIINHLLNNSSLQKKIASILSKYKLSENWFEAVFFYIIQNKNIIIDPKFKPDGVEIVGMHMAKDQEKFVWLKLGKDTTLEEVIAKWPNIQKAISKLPEYKPKRRGKNRTFFRDYSVYRMHLDNMTDAQIAIAIENKYDKKMEVGNIKTIVSRFKKYYS